MKYQVVRMGGLVGHDKVVLNNATKEEAEKYIEDHHSGILLGDGFTFTINEINE